MKKRKIPLRKCLGCQEMKNKKELIRIVRTEESFLVDFTGKKSGRGAYVCPVQPCLERAYKHKGLERSFKQAVPQEIYEQLQESIKESGS